MYGYETTTYHCKQVIGRHIFTHRIEIIEQRPFRGLGIECLSIAKY